MFKSLMIMLLSVVLVLPACGKKGDSKKSSTKKEQRNMPTSKSAKKSSKTYRR